MADIERTAGGQFRPGVSANPAGRPKNSVVFATRVRELTQDGERMLTVLLEILEDGDAAKKDRLRAAEILLDRCWGKPAQVVELDAHLETSADVPAPSRRARLAALLGLAVGAAPEAPGGGGPQQAD